MVKFIDGVIVGGYSGLYYIEVPDSTEDELDLLCEQLMSEYEELFETAMKETFGKSTPNSIIQGNMRKPTNDDGGGKKNMLAF